MAAKRPPEAAGITGVWLESWSFCQICIGVPFETFQEPSLTERSDDREAGLAVSSPAEQGLARRKSAWGAGFVLRVRGEVP